MNATTAAAVVGDVDNDDARSVQIVHNGHDGVTSVLMMM